MDEKPTVFAGDGIVLDNLDTDWGFTVDSQQGNSNRREVAVSLDQPSLEAVLRDRQLQDRVFDVPIIIALGKWLIEGEQIILLGDDLYVGEEVLLGGLERNAEVLEEVLRLIERISSGLYLCVDGVRLVVVLEVNIEVIDRRQVSNEVVNAQSILLDFLVLVVDQLILNDLVHRCLVLSVQQ